MRAKWRSGRPWGESASAAALRERPACSKHIIQTTAHKLRHTINALLRDHQPSRDLQINYEQVVVDRNARRWLCKLKRYGYQPPAGPAPDAKRPFPAGRKPTEGPQLGVALNARFL